MDLYSIGEFSRMSGLPVRTLRFYHDKGILPPTQVEAVTGYRFYSAKDLDVAQVVRSLRALDFSLETITKILADRTDDGDILEFLGQQAQYLQAEIQHRSDIVQTLESIITQETQARQFMDQSQTQVEEKNLEPILIGGIRMKGRYTDCGKTFGKLGRKLGRHISGKAMMLYYDGEYKEEDADFEPCMPLKRQVEAEGIHVRELPGGRAITLLHHGPFEELSRTYAHILEYAKSKDLTLKCPSREVYIKGPGMIFKGNPKRYITEIQFLVE